MKKTLLLVSCALLSATTGFSQFGTAHDFTVTDIEGNTHDLYTILDQGFVVVLDVSATWCGPCWGLHSAHYLRDLNTQMGPTGTNQIRVLFYEGDAATTMADLEGSTAQSQGDWITGTNYPIINESPLQLDMDVYAPLGFPTVNVIRPGDREITADVYDQDLAGMISAVDEAIESNPASIGSDWLMENGISVYPNPTADDLNIRIGNTEAVNDLTLRNTLGQVVRTLNVEGLNSVNISIAEIPAGIYMVELQKDGVTLGVQRVVKG